MTGPLIVGTVLAVAVIVFVVYAIVQGQRRRISAGVEEMLGKEAVVRTTLNPRGTVLAEGELWTAIAQDSTIEAGEEVLITRVEGLKLWVTRKPEKEAQ
jgi:membrane-bound ClpP family serine protease